MFCLPLAGSLAPTKSHKDRRWTFAPTTDLTQPALGTVTIVQGRKDCDSYGVDVEQLSETHEQVLFAKLDNAADVYGVVVERRTGKPVKCSCDGFNFGRGSRKGCKHIDCVVALIAEDIIPLKQVPAGCP